MKTSRIIKCIVKIPLHDEKFHCWYSHGKCEQIPSSSDMGLHCFYYIHWASSCGLAIFKVQFHLCGHLCVIVLGVQQQFTKAVGLTPLLLYSELYVQAVIFVHFFVTKEKYVKRLKEVLEVSLSGVKSRNCDTV